MNQPDQLDRLLSAWFEATAPTHEPAHLLDDVLGRAERTTRRPAWRIPERWIPVQTTMRFARTPALAPILILAALLILAAVAALATIGAQPRLPPPFGLADNGRIAYVSDGQIWTAMPDGTDARAITTGPATNGAPVFSQDGTRVAFITTTSPAVSDSDSSLLWSLIVAGADGTNQVVIERDVPVLTQYPSWSPDGRSIAYSSWIIYPGQRDRIHVATLGGSTRPQQIGDPDLSAFHPTFSPDGTRIAFISDHNDRFALHVMNADGSNIIELTDASVVPSADFDIGSRGFEWSPDGSRILFTGNPAVGPESARHGVYVVPADGSLAPLQISGDPQVGPTNRHAASWSPSGDRIVYLRGEPGGPQDVVVAGSDGVGARVIASGAANFSPRWSPDGRLVVFAEAGSGDRTLLIAEVDGPRDAITIPAGRSVTRRDANTVGWQRLGN